MYKSAIIFYFSGTGNTKILANIYSTELKNKGCKVKIYSIEEILREKLYFQISSFDLIGLGYPIHAFNAPRIVFDFIKELPLSKEEKPCFIFKCPGDSFINAGSTSMIRKSLRNKGYTVFHEDLVIMPANVFVKYEDELSKELYEIAKRKIKIFTDGILVGRKKLQNNSLWLRLITSFVSKMESNGARIFGKHLQVLDSCNSCMVCTKICPTNNIRFAKDRITFDWNCVLCMRCIYKCPQKAISPKFLKFFVLKGGYDIENIINNLKSRPGYAFEGKDGFTKRLNKYINELN